MVVYDAAPLDTELGILVHQRHEIIRESGLASLSLGAHDPVKRDLYQAEPYFLLDLYMFQYAVQRGQIRVTAFGDRLVVGFTAALQRVFVFLYPRICKIVCHAYNIQ